MSRCVFIIRAFFGPALNSRTNDKVSLRRVWSCTLQAAYGICLARFWQSQRCFTAPVQRAEVIGEEIGNGD